MPSFFEMFERSDELMAKAHVEAEEGATLWALRSATLAVDVLRGVHALSPRGRAAGGSHRYTSSLSLAVALQQELERKVADESR